MHNVLDQAFNPANLCHHEWGILWLDAKDHTHFQLHRESVFRDHLKWTERVDHLARGPFHSLVCRGNNNGCDCQRVHIVTTRADNGLLYATITLRHDICFVSSFIKPTVGWIASKHFRFDLFRRPFVVDLVKTSCSLLCLLSLFALHSLAYFLCHLAADLI